MVFDKVDGKDVSYMEVKSTGERVPLARQNRVYGLALDLDAGSQPSPFGRRGQRL